MISVSRSWLLAAFVLFFSAPCMAQPLIIAHRGASHVAPENTLASFREAWARDADGIEGDFYLTSDGRIVCIHDKDTERTTGRKHVVSETPFETLRQLDAGSWKDAKYAGEKIPTFDEVAAIVPKGKWFFIELKVGPEIVAPMREAIEKSNLDPKRTIFISFDRETLAECRKQIPQIETQWLSSFKRPKGDQDWSRATPTVETIVKQANESGASSIGLQCNVDVIDREFLDSTLTDNVRAFGVWTVDEPSVAKYFAGLKAFAVTTNKPALIREAISESKD